MKQVPFAKPDLSGRESELLLQTLESGWITQGPRVQAFEEAFAAAVGARHAVAVSSCTAALHLSLVAAGIKPGDEVIVPAHSFIATANAVVHAGATPIFADIDPATLNLSPEAASAAITARTAAILCVHQIGHPAELDALRQVCRSNGLLLLEDAACAIGSQYCGKPIGGNEYAPFVAFSFHPRKVLTTGDGGMITTGDDAYAERLRRLRQHGMSVSDLNRHKAGKLIAESYLEVGYNYRMTDLQASLGVAQVERLGEIVAVRRALAERYDDKLADLEHVIPFREPGHHYWNRQTYMIRLTGPVAGVREALMSGLLERGVATRFGITSIHREPAYEGKDNSRVNPLIHSENASDTCIALPLYSGLPMESVDYVVENLASAIMELT